MEEKSLQEVLYENKMRVREQIKERELVRKVEKKKDKIMAIFIVGAIILMCGCILATLNNKIQADLDKCIETHSVSYCERGA